MTEARIKVYNGDITEFSAPVSQRLDQRIQTLGVFEPPVIVEHGTSHDDSVILTQGENAYQKVEPGEITRFHVDKKIIEIAHQGEIIRFKR